MEIIHYQKFSFFQHRTLLPQKFKIKIRHPDSYDQRVNYRRSDSATLLCFLQIYDQVYYKRYFSSSSSSSSSSWVFHFIRAAYDWIAAGIVPIMDHVKTQSTKSKSISDRLKCFLTTNSSDPLKLDKTVFILLLNASKKHRDVRKKRGNCWTALEHFQV